MPRAHRTNSTSPSTPKVHHFALIAAIGIAAIFLPPGLTGQESPTIKSARGPAGTSAKPSFDSSIRPIWVEYCTGCHGATKPKGGLNLADFRDEKTARSQGTTWNRVAEYIEGGMMPPEDRPQP